MRLTTARRLGPLACAALAAVSCTEAPIAPRPDLPAGAARVALAPSFSPAAVRAFGAMRAFGFAVTNVRVVLQHPGGGVAIDTIVPVAQGQSEVTLQLEVPVQGAQAPFDALVQLRDGTRVLFEGTQRVIAALPGTAPGAQPPAPAIPMNYVGPGATARRVEVAPRDTIVATGASLTFAARALDADGQRVKEAVVAWSVSDASLGTVGAEDGAFVAGQRRGTVRVRAMLPSGVGDSITVRVVPPPVAAVVVSGAGQSGAVGTALAEPVVVEVRAADGGPAPGVRVRVVASRGARAEPASAVTDSAGRVAVQVTLGATPGTDDVTITAGALSPVTVSATATAGAPARILTVSGSGQRGDAGRAAAEPLVVRVTDAHGNPVPGAVVAWAVSTGTGRLSAASGTTGEAGTTSVGYTFGSTAGTESVTATLAGDAGTATDADVAQRSTTFILIVARSGGPGGPADPPGPPTPHDTSAHPPGGPKPPPGTPPTSPDSVTGLRVVHGSATGDPGNHLLIAVRALAGQRPVAGVSVRWTVTEGPVVIDAASATSVTDAEGIARMTLAPRGNAGNGAARYVVRAELAEHPAISVEVRSVDAPAPGGRVAARPPASLSARTPLRRPRR